MTNGANKVEVKSKKLLAKSFAMGKAGKLVVGGAARMENVLRFGRRVGYRLGREGMKDKSVENGWSEKRLKEPRGRC